MVAAVLAAGSSARTLITPPAGSSFIHICAEILVDQGCGHSPAHPDEDPVAMSEIS
jgi:hypothetical protein